MISNLKDLAQHVEAARDEGTEEEIRKYIAKRLFRATTCGIGFALIAPGRRCVGTRQRNVQLRFDVVDGEGHLRFKSAWDYAEGESICYEDQDWRVLLDADLRAFCELDDDGICRHRLGVVVWANKAATVEDRVLTLHYEGTTRLFEDHQGGVLVAGYCEGTDAECPSIELFYPFTEEEWAAAVASADADGCALWNDTHGCEDCGVGEGEHGWPMVNPECPTCEGHGIVL